MRSSVAVAVGMVAQFVATMGGYLMDIRTADCVRMKCV